MEPFEILIVILSIVLIVVLLFVAAALFYFVNTVRQVKHIADRATQAVDTDSNAASAVKNATKATSVAEIVRGVRSGLKNEKYPDVKNKDS